MLVAFLIGLAIGAIASSLAHVVNDRIKNKIVQVKGLKSTVVTRQAGLSKTKRIKK